MQIKRESIIFIGRSRRYLSDAILERDAKKDDRISDFVTDACATVGIAYHRAAGVYTMDEEMQELGTAAVHLLTIATSYMRAHRE